MYTYLLAMKTTGSLISPKGVITYFLSNTKNVTVISNVCVRVVIDEDKNMSCLNIYMKYINFRLEIRKIETNSKK